MFTSAFGVKTTLVSLSAAAALFLANPAFAAGTIVVEQKSPTSEYGQWTLITPDGSKINSAFDALRTISDKAGTYSFQLSAPEEIVMAIKLSRNGVVEKTTTDTSFTFLLKDNETVNIAITYQYDGTITVKSAPEGMAFELVGGGLIRLTGTTPMTFTGMPPMIYFVSFSQKDNCLTPARQRGTLRTHGSIVIRGEYDCTIEPTPEPTPPEEVLPPVTEGPAQIAYLRLETSQDEVLPGAAIRTSIFVKNNADNAIGPVTLSLQYDKANVIIKEVLPEGGTQQDDVILWTIPTIPAHTSWSVTIPLTVASSTTTGMQLPFSVRISGEDLDLQETGLSVTATVGVTGLPQTGVGFDALFLMISGFAALAVTPLARKGKIG